MSDYVPVPVEAARKIARDCEKHIVIVVAWDAMHDKTHCTTYAVHPEHKTFAAEMGERCMAAIGVNPSRGETFEDFRYRPQAEAAAEIDRLKGERDQLRELVDFVPAGIFVDYVPMDHPLFDSRGDVLGRFDAARASGRHSPPDDGRRD